MFGSKKPRKARDQPTSTRFAFPIEIERPAGEVWALLEGPEGTTLFRGDVVSAITMPNTGHGVGEVQAFVYRQHGRLVGAFIEIVEFEPGRRAVHRNLGENLPARLGRPLTETLVEELGIDRSRLTHAVTVNAAPGYVLTPDLVDELGAGYATFFEPLNERVKAVLEGSRE